MLARAGAGAAALSGLPLLGACGGSETPEKALGFGAVGKSLLDSNGKFSSAETGRALLVMNHESPADGLEVLKEINHHGVSVTEVGRNAAGQWAYKLDSAYNRRVNGQGWHTVSTTDNRFSRWDNSAVGASAAADFRNEPNTFGDVVEMDPLATTTPAKRVALGRFAHEACVCGTPVVGKPLAFYMGDDSRNEYISKFVTAANWDDKDVGAGTWLELTLTNPAISGYTGYTFADQADVLVNARHAADGDNDGQKGSGNPNGHIIRFKENDGASTATGLTESADGKTLFVNIQHPGENTASIGTAASFTFESQWPGNAGYGPTGRPRSATIAITRTDGV